MPCATIHLHLADRVLEEWKASPALAPFDPREPGTADAFLHGSLAPDMGFVPGLDRFLSELSHYHSTGELTRRLVSSASTAKEAAFAWGWVAHLLGDVALHPEVGRACGEYVSGDRELRLNSSDNLPVHVGMEVGLDMHLLTSGRPISAPPRAPVFDMDGIGFLTTALAGTYGITWDREKVFAMHRRATRFTGAWPLALKLMARKSLFARMSAGAARTIAPGGSAMAGFFRPLAPPAWLIRNVERFARSFTDHVQAHVGGGLGSLGNPNLETGTEEVDVTGHPDSARALRRLRERQRYGTAL
jgi:hypothetical protein